MKLRIYFIVLLMWSLSPFAATSEEDKQLRQEVQRLQQQTLQLQKQLNQLQHEQHVKHVSASHVQHASTSKEHHSHFRLKNKSEHHKKSDESASADKKPVIYDTPVYVHALKGQPESVELYPTALLSENHVVTYIAGTPIITAPYLGSRPAFDGSDYIVNISSINRDIRLMQQRQQLYNAYSDIGYDVPNTPILALSGKVEPIGSFGQTYTQDLTHQWNLGSAELDLAAALNDKVQGYISLAYNPSLPAYSAQRVANSGIGLGMAFVNIGDLDATPIYFTAGQLFAPFGRFSTSMTSAPLTMILGRTKSRPFILGYKSQYATGPFAAVYGFDGDTTLGDSGVGGANLGYIWTTKRAVTELGVSFISSINSAGGFQSNGVISASSNFAGFASLAHGSEAVKNIPALDVHGNFRFDQYILTAEWVGAIDRFRPQDLSFMGNGARPQALQLEAGFTFKSFDKPASLAVGYQWTQDALAINLPKNRVAGVYSISIWKDTIESIEYRHDFDYKLNQYANGAAPAGVVNTNIVATGKGADTILAQIGVYF